MHNILCVRMYILDGKSEVVRVRYSLVTKNRSFKHNSTDPAARP